MGKLLLIAIIFIVAFSGNAQEEKRYFSEALSMHLPKYEEESRKAYRFNNPERAAFLYDSLVKHCLNGTFLDNFKVKDLDKNDVSLNKFKKPVFLITQSSWLVVSEAKISALNTLATKYQGQIQFILLFWDTHKSTKRIAKKYEDPINIFYVDETKNKSSFIVSNMKHSLGLPTYFLLDGDQKIIDIKRSASYPYGTDFKKSFELDHNSLTAGISLLLIDNSSQLTHNIKDAK